MLLAESFVERNGTVFQILAGVLIAVVTGLLTWYFGYRNRTTKTLDYRLVSDIPIVASTERPQTLKIMLGSIEVTNPIITQIRFKNTGKAYIEESDFLEPIRIVRNGARIVDFNVVGQSANNLVPYISRVSPLDGQAEEISIEVTPTTMNSSDWFDVQVVYDGETKSRPEITSRIKGRTRETRQIIDRPRFVGPVWILIQSLIAVGVGALLVFGGSSLNRDLAIPVAGAIATVLALVVTLNFVNERLVYKDTNSPD